MVRQNPQPIERNPTARELAALVRALPSDRRATLLEELETGQGGGKYAAELDFSVTFSQRAGRYWYATCTYAGRSFCAYVGLEHDEQKARARLAQKIRNWLDKAEGQGT